MKIKYIIPVLMLGALNAYSAPNPVNVSSEISHVTVFLSGAEVERTASKQLERGTSLIVFTDLSNNLNENSIQVTGTGNFTILSVSKKRNFLTKIQETPEYQLLADSLKIAKDEIWVQQELKKVYQQEYEMLLANKKIEVGSNASYTVQDIKDLSAFYSSKLKSLMKQRMKATREELKLQKDIARLQNQLNEMARIRKYSSEVTVEVLAETATRANFKLKYMVSGAGWTPTYNIRANSNDEKVDIAYTAKVAQSTGVSWDNVDLTLSTANPNVSPIMPSLQPWMLYFSGEFKKKYGSYENRSFAYEDNAVAKAHDVDMLADKRAETISKQVVLSESQLNLSYDIQIPYTIPNDGQAHSINIKNVNIPADFQYYTTPKLSQKAYLMASISEWEKYSLISGSANVYFDDTYIGKTYINAKNTDEQLKVSMGSDQQVIVTRKRIEDFCEKQVIGSNKKETIGLKVSLKNTKMTSIDVQIIEQIPISSNEEIEVELLESEGATYDKKTGKLIWDITLAPGQSKNVVFKYRVKYPSGQKVVL